MHCKVMGGDGECMYMVINDRSTLHPFHDKKHASEFISLTHIAAGGEHACLPMNLEVTLFTFVSVSSCLSSLTLTSTFPLPYQAHRI